MSDLYPVTIVKDRYNGCYSGGKWNAFHLSYNQLHVQELDFDSSDNECNEFWFTHGDEAWVAVGNTPEEALNNLNAKNLDNKNRSTFKSKYGFKLEDAAAFMKENAEEFANIAFTPDPFTRRIYSDAEINERGTFTSPAGRVKTWEQLREMNTRYNNDHKS
jgi:hypothetical protein